tara:strand:- start:200 stop:514 length:315 start_codon:yes stop_codon:yes gene_type:complete
MFITKLFLKNESVHTHFIFPTFTPLLKKLINYYLVLNSSTKSFLRRLVGSRFLDFASILNFTGVNWFNKKLDLLGIGVGAGSKQNPSLISSHNADVIPVFAFTR